MTESTLVPAKKQMPARKSGRLVRNNRAPTAKLSNAQVNRALELHMKGVGNNEIARSVKASNAAISKLLRKFKPFLRNLNQVEAYRNIRTDVFDAAEMMTLKSVMDPAKHEKATLSQAAYAFEKLFNARRLENNQSTSNVELVGRFLRGESADK